MLVPMSLMSRRSVTPLLLSGLAWSKGRKSSLRYSRYRIVMDRQAEGYPVTAGHGVLLGREFRLVFSGFVHDEEQGGTTLVTSTFDQGKSWTGVEPFGRELAGVVVKTPEKEFLALSICGPTARGTVLAVGFHQQHGSRAGDSKQYDEDQRWRPGTALIGRQRGAKGPFDYQIYRSGTFLGEQFPAPGVVLASGRIVLQIWGARAPGENWRCGVLLSDDDGVSWKYRDVGYEPDLAIRNRAVMPAGFNEQTLFDLGRGRLVSIIRGREGLGRVPGSPRDTFYFRSVSADGGETWSKPEATDMAGTGAPPAGVVLEDGSLLTTSRVCYQRGRYPLPDKNLFGLIFFRSRDEGRTWQPEKFYQHDPAGTEFDNHYNAMNGQFLRLGRNRYRYLFPQFDVKRKIQRLLGLELETG